jgi:hypothetical protein
MSAGHETYLAKARAGNAGKSGDGGRPRGVSRRPGRRNRSTTAHHRSRRRCAPSRRPSTLCSQSPARMCLNKRCRILQLAKDRVRRAHLRPARRRGTRTPAGGLRDRFVRPARADLASARSDSPRLCWPTLLVGDDEPFRVDWPPQSRHGCREPTLNRGTLCESRAVTASALPAGNMTGYDAIRGLPKRRSDTSRPNRDWHQHA